MDMYTDFIIYVIAFVAAVLTLFAWRYITDFERKLGKRTLKGVFAAIVKTYEDNEAKIEESFKKAVIRIADNKGLKVKEEHLDKLINEYKKQLKDQNKQ